MSRVEWSSDQWTNCCVVIPKPTRRKCHSDVFSVATAAVHVGHSVTLLVVTAEGDIAWLYVGIAGWGSSGWYSNGVQGCGLGLMQGEVQWLTYSMESFLRS